MSDSLWPYGPWPATLLCPWDSPGKNTGYFESEFWFIYQASKSQYALINLFWWRLNKAEELQLGFKVSSGYVMCSGSVTSMCFLYILQVLSRYQHLWKHHWLIFIQNVNFMRLFSMFLYCKLFKIICKCVCM